MHKQTKKLHGDPRVIPSGTVCNSSELLSTLMYREWSLIVAFTVRGKEKDHEWKVTHDIRYCLGDA